MKLAATTVFPMRTTFAPALSNSTCLGPPEILKKFDKHFGEGYKYLALVICLFGVVTNTLNVIVLNHRTMRSVTNFLLTSLAVCNGLIMALYMPFDAYFLIGNKLHACPKPWANYLLVHLVVQNILHALSSWLTVTLAVFRWIYIQFPTRCRQLCSQKRAYFSVTIVMIISVLVSIPYMMGHFVNSVPPKQESSDSNSTQFTVDFTDNDTLRKLLFWVMAIWIKFIPVVLLSLLSGLLINQLRHAERRRNKLKNRSSASAGEQDKDVRSNRTTKMLVTIVFIFIIAFLPQALLLLLDSTVTCFTQNYSQPLGDLTDLVTLLNCSITFVLYCGMSKQFRDTFDKLFCVTTRQCFSSIVAATTFYHYTRPNENNQPPRQHNHGRLNVRKNIAPNGEGFQAVRTEDEDEM